MSCMNDDVVMCGVKWRSEGCSSNMGVSGYASSKDGIQCFAPTRYGCFQNTLAATRATQPSRILDCTTVCYVYFRGMVSAPPDKPCANTTIRLWILRSRKGTVVWTRFCVMVMWLIRPQYKDIYGIRRYEYDMHICWLARPMCKYVYVLRYIQG